MNNLKVAYPQAETFENFSSNQTRFLLDQGFLMQTLEKGFHWRQEDSRAAGIDFWNQYEIEHCKKYGRNPDLIDPSIKYTPVEPVDPIKELLLAAKITLSEEVITPAVCLEITGIGESTIIGTLGNFSVVIGKAKSKKTFLVSICLAAAISHENILGKIKGALPPDRSRVILFDTEQAKQHVQTVMGRVHALSGSNKPVLFDVYGLRKYSPAARMEMIEFAIYNTPDLGFIVIDGIRDLVIDINSAEEATNMVSKLLKWTEERNIHICVVLHQNKNDFNARGHLGTEVVNKAETVVSVTKDTKNENVSVVRAEYCRDKEFAPFTFGIDQDGIPSFAETIYVAEKGTRRGLGNPDPDESKAIIEEVFSMSPELSYGDVLSGIGKAYLLKNSSIGVNRQKQLFKYFIEEKSIILKGKVGNHSVYKCGLG